MQKAGLRAHIARNFLPRKPSQDRRVFPIIAGGRVGSGRYRPIITQCSRIISVLGSAGARNAVKLAPPWTPGTPNTSTCPIGPDKDVIIVHQGPGRKREKNTPARSIYKRCCYLNDMGSELLIKWGLSCWVTGEILNIVCTCYLDARGFVISIHLRQVWSLSISARLKISFLALRYYALWQDKPILCTMTVLKIIHEMILGDI